MKSLVLLWVSVFFLLSPINSQKKSDKFTNNIEQKRWRDVATRMPSDWYGSEEAVRIAENVILAQKEIGGWAKNKPYHHVFTSQDKEQFLKEKSEVGATIDNRSTTMEIRFLANVYSKRADQKYKDALLKGVHYLLNAQYANGGWPQFFPPRKNVPYSAHITYNDDAMVKVMVLLRDIINHTNEMSVVQFDEDIIQAALNSFNQGVECILKTQIVVDGKPTIWCAQHDEVTFKPADARSYELASFSGAESVNIVLLLMAIDTPSKEVVAAIDGAVEWFENHKIEHLRISQVKDKLGRENRIVVADSAASPLWARFYDLESEKAYFCDRDGVKKETIAEIGFERRNGYGWYTDSPAKILKKYPMWKAKNNPEN